MEAAAALVAPKRALPGNLWVAESAHSCVVAGIDFTFVYNPHGGYLMSNDVGWDYRHAQGSVAIMPWAGDQRLTLRYRIYVKARDGVVMEPLYNGARRVMKSITAVSQPMVLM